MKLNKYFLIGAMGLGLFACSDDLDGNGQDNGNKVQEGTTYAAFTLKFSNGLGARNVDGSYDDTDEKTATAALESAVKTVRIIVVSGTNIEYNKTLEVADDNKYVIAMEPGAKKFYAIINEDEAFTGETEADLTTYLTGTSVTTGVSSITSSDKGFMMSNVKVVGATITADVSEADAPVKNPVEIEVDRVAAKATVKKGLADDYTYPDGIANIGDIEFALGNADLTSTTGYQTTGFYRMQKAGTETGLKIAETPYSLFVPATNASHTTPATANYVSILDETYPRPLYCLENTHKDTDYKQGNTTYAAIRVPILLNKVVKINYTDGKVTAIPDQTVTPGTDAQSFYWIYGPNGLRGKYILSSDIQSLITSLNDQTVTVENIAEKIAESIPGFSMSAEYTGGYGYYKAWLNPDQTGITSPVYRNNWYELTITKLTLPGEPGEPVIVPDQPLNPDTNAEITVAIRNWNKVSHDITLQ